MKRNESIQHLMTKNVHTVHLAQKLSDVRKTLADNRIHHVPVVNGAKLVGMFSASDMLRMNYNSGGIGDGTMDAVLDHQQTIEQAMSKDLVTLDAKSTVRDAARILAEGTFHAVPVVDEDRTLLGIVTTTDLVRYLIQQY